MSERVRLVRGLFNRWVIVPATDNAFAKILSMPDCVAWSGSRWVRVDGPVQVCNFDTEAQAAGYATSLGFEVEG